MSTITQVTTLRTEDFPSEERSWIPRLLTPLNLFMTNVTQALSGRLLFGSNIQAQDVSLDFVYQGNSESFRYQLATTPKFLLLGECIEATAQVPLSSTWNYNASRNTISVTFYKTDGSLLTQGRRYRINLRIIP